MQCDNVLQPGNCQKFKKKTMQYFVTDVLVYSCLNRMPSFKKPYTLWSKFSMFKSNYFVMKYVS